MCVANLRRRARGRPRHTRNALAGGGLALKIVDVVVGQSTTRIAGDRCRRRTPCAGTEVRHLGRHQRTRILGRDKSHFGGAGSGARALTLVGRRDRVWDQRGAGMNGINELQR